MRKFALVLSAVLLFASLVYAQQVDVALGAGSLFSSKNTTASQVYPTAPEKGGIYPNFSADVIFKNRIGFSGEIAVRAKRGLYNGFQGYRPVLYDLNAVFAPRLSKKTGVDFMGGIGGQSVLFYSQDGSCGYPAGCPIHISSNRLLAHVGADIRYSVWGHFFVRPEVHYYRIFNNTTDFTSNNLFRLGASIGYTIGP